MAMSKLKMAAAAAGLVVTGAAVGYAADVIPERIHDIRGPHEISLGDRTISNADAGLADKIVTSMKVSAPKPAGM